MTVSTEENRIQYTGNGSTIVFSFPYKFFDDSDLVVTLTNTAVTPNVDTVQTITTDYTVSGGSGAVGSVTMLIAPISTERLTIERILPLTQATEYTDNVSTPADNYEEDFDRLAMIAQQNQDKLNRALTYPSSDSTALSAVLPGSAERANGYFAFDANGEPTIISSVADAPVSSFWQGVVNLSDIYTSRLALGNQANALNLCPNPRYLHTLASTPAAPADNDYILPGIRILMESSNAAVPTVNAASTISNTDPDGQPLFISERLRLTVGATNNAKFGIFIPIESNVTDMLRNMDAALQCAMVRNASGGINDMRMAVICWTGAGDSVTADPISSWGAAGTNPTLAANWTYANTPTALVPTATAQRFKIEGQVTIPSTATNVALFIWCDDKTTTSTTDWIEVANILFERGNICSEFSFPPLSVMESEVQRFYQYVAGNTKAIGVGQCITTSTARIVVPLKTTMRAVPTLSISSAAHFSVTQADGTLVACTGLSLNSASTPDVAVLDITVAATPLVAGNATRLVTSSASAILEILARL